MSKTTMPHIRRLNQVSRRIHFIDIILNNHYIELKHTIQGISPTNIHLILRKNKLIRLKNKTKTKLVQQPSRHKILANLWNIQDISQLELFLGCHLQDYISFALDISSCRIAHVQLFSIVNRSERVKHTLISTHMTGSPSINPPFPVVGTYQVNFRDHGNDVRHHSNHVHIIIHHISLAWSHPLRHLAISSTVTRLVTIEAHPLELLFHNCSFRSKVLRLPFALLVILSFALAFTLDMRL